MMQIQKCTSFFSPLRKWDLLLVVGVVLSPMTGLRVMKIGPAELLCLTWCFPYVKKMMHSSLKQIFIKFWILFGFFIVLGTLYGLYFYPRESSPLQLITYLYFFLISSLVYSELEDKKSEDINCIFSIICCGVGLWYFILYLYSFVNSSFIGAPLWYGGRARFTGGGTNPHQLAIALGVTFFGNIRTVLTYSNKMSIRVIGVISGLLCAFLATKVESSTLLVSLLVTAIVWICCSFLRKVKSKKNSIIMILFLFGVLIIILFNECIVSFFMKWLADDENGMGRLEIFKTIKYSLQKNAIIGLGPGNHAYNGTFEYHNTYLEILAMTGFLGLIVFSSFTVQIFRKLKEDYHLLCCVLPLYIYGLAGFAMRRLFFWTIVPIVIALVDKKKENNVECKNI